MGLIDAEWRRRAIERLASPALRDPNVIAAIGLGSGVLGTTAAVVEDVTDDNPQQDKMSIVLGSLLSSFGTPAAVLGLNQTLSNPRITGKLGVTLTRAPISPEVDALVSPEVATAIAQQPIAPEVQAAAKAASNLAAPVYDGETLVHRSQVNLPLDDVDKGPIIPEYAAYKEGDGKLTIASVPISAANGQNAILSNLAPRPMIYNLDGIFYKSAEHNYQTNKSGFFDQETYNAYMNAPDWTYIKGKEPARMGANGKENLELMEAIVLESIGRSPEAIDALLSGGDGGRFNYLDKGPFWNQAMNQILSKIKSENQW